MLTAETDEEAAQTDASPVFDHIAATMTNAIDLEVKRLVRLGLPVWVSLGGATEDLNADLTLTRQAEASKTA